jgi:hypothetical protein
VRKLEHLSAVQAADIPKAQPSAPHGRFRLVHPSLQRCCENAVEDRLGLSLLRRGIGLHVF